MVNRSDVNRFGLRRSDLTAVQKREVRQRSGFGCVKCGYAIGDYEHVDPEFKDAKTHDVENITFLCTRCHGNGTRRRLSKSTIKEHMKSPAALKKGFSFEEFDIGFSRPTIILGPIRAIRPQVALAINGTPILAVDEPEEPGGPFRLNAIMTNEAGQVIFEIENNVWKARTSNWDVHSVGQRTTIRNGHRDIALVIRTDPPDCLIVERMRMTFGRFICEFDGKTFSVKHPNGHQVASGKAELADCRVALDVSEHGSDHWRLIAGIGCRGVNMSSVIHNVPPHATKPPLIGYGDSRIQAGDALWQMIQAIRAKKPN